MKAGEEGYIGHVGNTQIGRNVIQIDRAHRMQQIAELQS